MDCDCFITPENLLAHHYLFEPPPDVSPRNTFTVTVNLLKQLAKQSISSGYPVICPEMVKMVLNPKKDEDVRNHQKVREKGKVEDSFTKMKPTTVVLHCISRNQPSVKSRTDSEMNF